MRASRRHLLAAVAGTYASIARYPAGAAEFTYKFGTEEAQSHPNAIRPQQACEKIMQDSGGRLELKFFPNSILGTASSMLTQVRAGALEFLALGDNILSTVAPVAAISSVPFAFGSYKDAWNAMDGPLGTYVRNQIEKSGLYVFDKRWDAGMRQVSNNIRPVVTPDDLHGLKLRVPNSPVTVALFKGLGTSPAVIGANEEYVALQSKLVDGFEQPLIGLESNRLYEVSKYVSITNHMWTGFTTIANGDAWSKLPSNLRDIVDRNLNAMSMVERNDIQKTDTVLENTLKGRGMVVNTANLEAFKAAVRKTGLYMQWRDSFGQDVWALLERAVGKLA